MLVVQSADMQNRTSYHVLVSVQPIGICRTKHLQMIEHGSFLHCAWNIRLNVVELEYYQQIGICQLVQYHFPSVFAMNVQ